MPLDETTIVQTLMAERVKLLAYIWSIVHDSHLVEDVFQEVSLLAVRKRGELRDKNALAAWLRKSARLIAIATVRHKGRYPALFSEEVLDKLDVLWTDGDVAAMDDTMSLLQHCMAKLSLRFREFITLRYVNRLSGGQIADRLDMSVDSVYVTFARIHRTLRECIQRNRESKGVTRD